MEAGKAVFRDCEANEGSLSDRSGSDLPLLLGAALTLALPACSAGGPDKESDGNNGGGRLTAPAARSGLSGISGGESIVLKWDAGQPGRHLTCWCSLAVKPPYGEIRIAVRASRSRKRPADQICRPVGDPQGFGRAYLGLNPDKLTSAALRTRQTLVKTFPVPEFVRGWQSAT